MQIRKSRGLGKIIEAAFDKSAGPFPRAKPMPGIQYGPEETIRGTPPPAAKPPMSSGTPGAAQKPAAPAAPAAPAPADRRNQMLMQQWNSWMTQHGPELTQMSQWAQKMATQPMVAKDQPFVQNLNQLAAQLQALPKSPTAVPAVQKQVEALSHQMKNFWIRWQQAYQKGHGFMDSSTKQLESFKKTLEKINMPGIAKNQPAPAPGATQNMGGFMV